MTVSAINSKITFFERNDPLHSLSEAIHSILKTGKVKKTDIEDAIYCYDLLNTFPLEKRDEITMRMVLLATSELRNKYKHLINQ